MNEIVTIDADYPYGVIGKSGLYYRCNPTEHIETCLRNKHDAPFVCLYENYAKFDAYYTANKDQPTPAQFETVMTWCAEVGVIFEDAVDCFSQPWKEYLG